MSKLNRRKFLEYTSAVIGTSVLVTGCKGSSASGASNPNKPIVLGSLLDSTGAIGVYGVQMVAATQMAVDEINAAGGLLGRQIELKQYDTQSVIQKYTQFSDLLTLGDNVDVLFGGITSASREAVRPVIDKYKTLYFYNTQYEGGVCDKYTFCTGMTPSAQLDKLLEYAANQFKAKTVYTIAADYNYGHISADWVKVYGKKYGMNVVAQDFVPLDVSDFSTIISKIQQAKAEAVMSLLVGSNHDAFYGQWAGAGLQGKIPVLSATFGHAYDQNGAKRPERAEVIVSSSYWKENPSEDNQRFIKEFHKRFGDNKYPNYLASDTYTGVMMWAKAVKQAGTSERQVVTKVLESGINHAGGPDGTVSFDKTHHINHAIYILKSNANQGFDLVAGPFPNIRAIDDQGRCNLIARPNTFTQFTPKT